MYDDKDVFDDHGFRAYGCAHCYTVFATAHARCPVCGVALDHTRAADVDLRLVGVDMERGTMRVEAGAPNAPSESRGNRRARRAWESEQRRAARRARAALSGLLR